MKLYEGSSGLSYILNSTQCRCEGSTPAVADECCRSREHEEGDLKGKKKGRGEAEEVRNMELGMEEVIDRRMDFFISGTLPSGPPGE